MANAKQLQLYLDSDEYSGKFIEPISQELIHQLSTINPYITISNVFFEWILIITAIFLFSFLKSPYNFIIYPFILIWIGARQNALGYLMHEGAHRLLFPKNKIINDLFSELFIAWPFFISMKNYRANHFPHHRFTNTKNDPDWMRKQNKEWLFPQTSFELFITFLKNLFPMKSLLYIVKINNIQNNNKSLNFSWDKLGRLFYYLIMGIFLTYFKLWWIFLLFWIIPGFTYLQVILRVRSIAEHFAIEYDHPFRQTRSTKIGLWEKLLVAPKNLNYHLEHHLYPCVPFYSLEELHRELMKSEHFRNNAHITNGYFGVLRECIAKNEIVRTG